MRILVTGAAGFIGYHLSERLLAREDAVVGLDNLNAYYDVSLKEKRLERLRSRKGFEFARTDITDMRGMAEVFESGKFDAVVNLAAQAGVRHSIENPRAYIDANIMGFMNVLEGARRHETGHLVFASTSSVYGLNTKLPLSEKQNTDHPASERTKARKDLLQAASLIEYFHASGEQRAFNGAWRDALRRGPGWRKRALEGKRELLRLAPDLDHAALWKEGK